MPLTAMADTLSLTFKSAGSNAVGHYYVSPYEASDRDTGEVLLLYCIDFNHALGRGPWQVRRYRLDYDHVRYLQYGTEAKFSEVWLKYAAAAWLITQLSQNADDPHMQAVYQYAAWAIFLDASHEALYDASVNAAGGQAFAAEINAQWANAWAAVQAGYAPSGWDVLTPETNGTPGSPQELLTPASPIPEPSSALLLATFLVAIGASWRTSVQR